MINNVIKNLYVFFRGYKQSSYKWHYKKCYYPHPSSSYMVDLGICLLQQSVSLFSYTISFKLHFKTVKHSVY